MDQRVGVSLWVLNELLLNEVSSSASQWAASRPRDTSSSEKWVIWGSVASKWEGRKRLRALLDMAL